MRDLKIEELSNVYGAGGKSTNCGCGKGGSKGGSKGKSKHGKSKSKHGKSKSKCR